MACAPSGFLTRDKPTRAVWRGPSEALAGLVAPVLRRQRHSNVPAALFISVRVGGLPVAPDASDLPHGASAGTSSLLSPTGGAILRRAPGAPRSGQLVISLGEAGQADGKSDALLRRLEDDEGCGLAVAQFVDERIVHHHLGDAAIGQAAYEARAADIGVVDFETDHREADIGAVFGRHALDQRTLLVFCSRRGVASDLPILVYRLDGALRRSPGGVDGQRQQQHPRHPSDAAPGRAQMHETAHAESSDRRAASPSTGRIGKPRISYAASRVMPALILVDKAGGSGARPDGAIPGAALMA